MKEILERFARVLIGKAQTYEPTKTSGQHGKGGSDGTLTQEGTLPRPRTIAKRERRGPPQNRRYMPHTDTRGTLRTRTEEVGETALPTTTSSQTAGALRNVPLREVRPSRGAWRRLSQNPLATLRRAGEGAGTYCAHIDQSGAASPPGVGGKK